MMKIMLVRNLCFCILLCLSDFSLALVEYPPGQAKDLWKWVESESASVGAFFRLPDDRGICLYHQVATDQWFSGIVTEVCLAPEGMQCLSSYIECHYPAGGKTRVLRESFWFLKSVPDLFLSKPETLYEQYRLRFPFADAEKGLCVLHDQKTNRTISGWIVTGENICKAGGIESEDYQQFQLIRHSLLDFGYLLLVAAGGAVSGTTVVVCFSQYLEF